MLDERDLQAIAAMLAPINTRLDKLESKVDGLESRQKEAEGRMIALMEAHFAKMIGSLTAGQDLILQKMAEQDELDDTKAELEGRLDILEAAVKLHSREIEKLKKAQ